MGGSLPLGYDPPKDPLNARVLQINPTKAATVRRIFALYADLGSLTASRQAAARQGLSPRKADHLPGAKPVGGDHLIAPFSNGQLHYFLTNPVYRGQIRHKGLIHPGQHDAIIDEALWTDVQDKLQSRSTRKRGSGGRSHSEGDHPPTSGEPASPLIGKLFDETGDRLTPSHTNRHNRRFRYYVSRRLITQGADPAGWRLPAPQLEALILTALRQHLGDRCRRHELLLAPNARETARHSATVALLISAKGADALWHLIAAVHLAQGKVRITLSASELARSMGLAADDLIPDMMTFEHPFELRRRGVEIRIVSGRPEPRPDPVLQRNLARAYRWVKALRNGQSLTNIAKAEACSESSLRSRLTLAFLAPNIQRVILDGTIAPEWTTDRLLRLNLPAAWTQQIRILGL